MFTLHNNLGQRVYPYISQDTLIKFIVQAKTPWLINEDGIYTIFENGLNTGLSLQTKYGKIIKTTMRF